MQSSERLFKKYVLIYLFSLPLSILLSVSLGLLFSLLLSLSLSLFFSPSLSPSSCLSLSGAAAGRSDGIGRAGWLPEPHGCLCCRSDATHGHHQRYARSPYDPHVRYNTHTHTHTHHLQGVHCAHITGIDPHVHTQAFSHTHKQVPSTHTLLAGISGTQSCA